MDLKTSVQLLWLSLFILTWWKVNDLEVFLFIPKATLTSHFILTFSKAEWNGEGVSSLYRHCNLNNLSWEKEKKEVLPWQFCHQSGPVGVFPLKVLTDADWRVLLCHLCAVGCRLRDICTVICSVTTTSLNCNASFTKEDKKTTQSLVPSQFIYS